MIPLLHITDSHHLGDPAVPTVDKLLHAHTAVTGHVEDHEEVRDLLAVQGVGLALLVLKQRRAESSELVDIDRLVASRKNIFLRFKINKIFTLSQLEVLLQSYIY